MKIKILDIIATPREIDIPDKCQNCSVSFEVKQDDIPEVTNNLRFWGIEEMVTNGSVVVSSSGDKKIDNFTATERVSGFVIRIACNVCMYLPMAFQLQQTSCIISKKF